MATGGSQDQWNVTGRQSSSRLPSIRSPRDLTLGQSSQKGILHAKITPNLNLVRKKPVPQAALDLPKPPEQKKARGRGRGRGGGERGRGGGERGRGRGRSYGGSGQGSTIFDQGIAEAPLLPSDRKRSYSVTSSSSSNSHGVAVKSEFIDEDDSELEVFSNLVLCDNFIDDGDTQDETVPILVPLGMDESRDGHSNRNPFIKEESEDSSMTVAKDDKSRVASLEQKLLQLEMDDMTRVNSHVGSEYSLTSAEILQDADKSGKMIILKVPDILPLVPIQPPEPAKTEEESTADEGREKQEKKEVPITAFFRDYPEGPVGKMRVRKSGKVEWVIGDNVLEIKPGAPVKMLTEAVSVRLDESGGHMSVLGHVNHKLVACPDFVSMMTCANR